MLARCTGAPPANSTFFCEPASNLCYHYNSRMLNFTSARAACQALGGDMAMYNTADKQLAVEHYFAGTNLLTPFYYWTGVRRTTSNTSFTFVDGSMVSQVPSNQPYGHWNWYQPIAAEHIDYNCVLAYKAYTYDLYTGDSSAAQVGNASYFQTATNLPTRRYGWSSYLCRGQYPSICEVPAEAFPCSLPPVASPPPP